MGPAAAAGVELVGQTPGAPGVIVHILDESVLDGHAPPGGAEVVVGTKRAKLFIRFAGQSAFRQ